MRTLPSLLTALVFGLLAATSAAAPQNDDTLYGLFIGNSYCDFYVIPDQVEAMVNHAGGKGDMRRETEGGFSLAKHFNAGRAQERITGEVPWDFVVLQNHSRTSLDQRPLFDEYGARFIDFIRQNAPDTEIYLYLTWARKHLPQDQSAITEAYCTLAVENDVNVVPVGEAFASWMREHPEHEILRDDKASHPNELGAYLSACVFYAAVTGESPVGQTARIEGYNWLTEGQTLVDLDADLARRLQEHAWATMQSFDPQAHAKTAAR